MSSFTGRRNTGRASRVGRGILDGLSVLGTALADGPKITRIKEIDAEMERLQHERDSLIVTLTQDYEGYEVSEDYDPNKAVIMHVRPGEGRLTKCAGSWRDNDPFDKSHPGCPYRKTQHVGHEFTLRD
jgi:hypothetical protein